MRLGGATSAASSLRGATGGGGETRWTSRKRAYYTASQGGARINAGLFYTVQDGKDQAALRPLARALAQHLPQPAAAVALALRAALGAGSTTGACRRLLICPPRGGVPVAPRRRQRRRRRVQERRATERINQRGFDARCCKLCAAPEETHHHIVACTQRTSTSGDSRAASVSSCGRCSAPKWKSHAH